MKTAWSVYGTLSVLLSIACGGGGSSSATESNTGTTGATEATTAAAATTSPSGDSVGDSDTPTTTAGTVSNGQTDTGDTTDTTAAPTTPVSASDTDTTATATATDTTGPVDPSLGETSSSGDSPSVGDTTDSTTTSTSDGTTTDATTTDATTTDATTGEPVQCGLTLQATIRDFKLGHPDFESWCCAQVNGLVQTDLGPNNKPVMATLGNPQMLTSADIFTQWYTDVANVNQKTTIDINLAEIQPGVFSYSSSNFFPVDNMLWGNEGLAHNFHFTTEIHSKFQYSGGETFTFSGDDDVWVFINKKLVIDLGGVHGETAKAVSVDTLGLSLGSTYPLDVFHAERHTTQSNFRIDTTICSNPQ